MEVLEEQATAGRWHRQMTEYLDALTEHIGSLRGDSQDQAREWHEWASRQVAQHHPFSDELGIPADPNFTPQRLQPHMQGFPAQSPDGVLRRR